MIAAHLLVILAVLACQGFVFVVATYALEGWLARDERRAARVVAWGVRHPRALNLCLDVYIALAPAMLAVGRAIGWLRGVVS